MKKPGKILGILLIICGLILILKPLAEHGYNYFCQLQLRSEIDRVMHGKTDSGQPEFRSFPLNLRFCYRFLRSL